MSDSAKVEVEAEIVSLPATYTSNKTTSASEEATVELRVEALREAASIISSDRNKSYGGPEENFDRIAKLWTMLFGVEFSHEDVAMAMVAVKMARFMNRSGGFQRDTWIDIAGYAGCGYEVGLKAAQG
jgi:hypothetical protein